MKKSDKRQRTELVGVRLTPNELQQIRKRAAGVGRSLSGYFRDRGLSYRIRSVSDQQVAVAMYKYRADMGRLGGLLKLWLSTDEIADQGRQLNVPELLDQIGRQMKDVTSYMHSIQKNDRKTHQ